MRNAITHDEVVVYSDVGDHLRNITGVWERSNCRSAFPEIRTEPRRIEVGNPLLAYLLGPEWFPLENGFRWMPRGQLCTWAVQGRPKISCFSKDIARRQLKAGDVHLSVSVDEFPLANMQIIHPEGSFHRLLTLPPSLTGQSAVTVALQVDQVIHEPGGRELGLVFGTIAIE